MTGGFAFLESVLREALDNLQKIADGHSVASEQVLRCYVGQRNVFEVGRDLIKKEAEIASEVRFALGMSDDACKVVEDSSRIAFCEIIDDRELKRGLDKELIPCQIISSVKQLTVKQFDKSINFKDRTEQVIWTPAKPLTRLVREN